MSRILCLGCQRPEKACICAFTADIANDIHVLVLQHPSEVSQSKGTVALLAKSLQSCQVLVGEVFEQQPDFLQVLAQYQAVLLYPGAQAQVLSRELCASFSLSLEMNKQASLVRSDLAPEDLAQHASTSQKSNSQAKVKPLCLVILDGTWKKAYRMFMLSTKLAHLPQVSLPEHLANAGQYHIRKVAKKNALSSLEACCYALALLEAGSDVVINNGTANNMSQEQASQAGKYQPLLEKFNQFNQFHLSFRPEKP